MTAMASKITGVKWRHHVQCNTGYSFDRNPCYVRMMWVRMFLYSCMRVSVGQIYRSPTPGLLFNKHKCYLIIPRGQIAAISQTTCSNAFLWMKKNVFWFKFHWRFYLRVQLTISQHGFRQYIGAKKATSHYLKPMLTQFLDAYMRHEGGMR